jgi:prepilin-type N-terminal cleavage/methylation domain-containing protein
MHPTSPSLSTLRHSRAGFTLVELITVIAIATILASLSFPAFSGIQSAKFSDSVSLLSDYVKQSQVLARSSNSYVWIGFAQNPQNLEVVALQGTAGLSTDLPGQVRQIARPLYLPNVVLDTAGKLPSGSQTPGFGTLVSQSTLGSSSNGQFTWTVGGSARTFGNTIGITPRGEFFLASPSIMVHWVQVGVAPFPYNASSGQMPSGKAPANFGQLFIAGLTGQVDIVRP